MTPQPYPPTFLPHYPILNPLEKQLYINERHNMTLEKVKMKKSKNVGNITSVMGYYPRMDREEILNPH